MKGLNEVCIVPVRHASEVTESLRADGSRDEQSATGPAAGQSSTRGGGQAVRLRPTLCRLLRDIERQSQRPGQGSSEQLRAGIGDMCGIVDRLLLVEEELWQIRGRRLPWEVTRWAEHAGAFIRMCQRTCSYAAVMIQQDPSEASSALRSACHFGVEAVVALGRFDQEALRLDETMAIRLETTMGWGPL